MGSLGVDGNKMLNSRILRLRTSECNSLTVQTRDARLMTTTCGLMILIILDSYNHVVCRQTDKPLYFYEYFIRSFFMTSYY